MESVYKRKGCGPQGLGSPKKQVEKRVLDKEKINKALKGVAGFFAGNYLPGVKDANEEKAREMNAEQNRSSGGQGSSEKPESNNKKKANCWKGYKAVGKKKSPSGKKTKGGKTKMVNNCVKIKK